MTVYYTMIGNSSIMVPDNMTIDEAIKYAKDHMNEIPLPSNGEYVCDSDELDEENCDFEENCLIHIFDVEWDTDKIDFFVDGYLYQRILKSTVTKKGEWVYDHPFFLILNIAVGGNFAGFPTSETPFPQKMTIDYVRAYELAE